MDNKFDELAKGLAQSVTRRQALKKLGAGLAGVALACFGLANGARAGTKTCSTNADCGNNLQCCSGTCVSITDNNNCGLCGNVCPAGHTCKDYSLRKGRGHIITCAPTPTSY